MKYPYTLMIYYNFPGKKNYKIVTSRCKTVENCLKSVKSRQRNLSGKYICAYEIYDKSDSLVKKEQFSSCSILGINPTVWELNLVKNRETIISDFEELINIIDAYEDCTGYITLSDESKDSLRNIYNTLKGLIENAQNYMQSI